MQVKSEHGVGPYNSQRQVQMKALTRLPRRILPRDCIRLWAWLEPWFSFSAFRKTFNFHPGCVHPCFLVVCRSCLPFVCPAVGVRVSEPVNYLFTVPDRSIHCLLNLPFSSKNSPAWLSLVSRLCFSRHKKEMSVEAPSESTGGGQFALHLDDPGWMPGILDCPQGHSS